MTIRSAWWAFGILWVVVACGGGTVPGGVAPESRDGAVGETGEVLEAEAGEDTAPDPTAGESPEPGDSGWQETQWGQGPGLPGWPCEDNSECYSGYCVETPEGRVCSAWCAEAGDCPPEYQCVQVATKPDVIYVCVHTSPNVCRPCRTQDDCEAAFVSTPMACVEMAGRFFCLKRCGEGEECPSGGSCASLVGETGDASLVCVPEGGACECRPKDVAAATPGACVARNEDGACVGSYTCLEEGPGPCDAPVPAAEACDNADNDCDGETDEDITGTECELKNLVGTCRGRTVCAGGQVICEGAYAVPETCNGQDDDCDGETDEDVPQPSSGPECLHAGVCAYGVPYQCAGGQWVCHYAAVPGYSKEDLACSDCLDNDCDGQTDEDECADCCEVPPACDPDWDEDGVPNSMDNCAMVPNPNQENKDGDAQGDACDADDDEDGVPDASDNCPFIGNPGQDNTDGDATGDACDCDVDGDGAANPNPGCPGCGPCDNCPSAANPDQKDTDQDGVGDACDPDDDNDGVGDGLDNCPTVVNPGQEDLDQDGLGDACDGDRDGDGVLNGADNCPGTPNAGQEDANHNGVGDACENDWDGDGIWNEDDNCPWDYNPKQEDQDLDGIGDVCDADRDGDGVANGVDNCPATANPLQEDQDGDGLGDVCDPDRDGDGDPNASDCGADDPVVHHGGQEVCNGADDNCNGLVDEAGALGCQTFYEDQDQDGYGTFTFQCRCAAESPFTATVPGDCDDQSAAVSPGGQEVCGNGRDDNCDGVTDSGDNALGCVSYYMDGDGDGWGLPYARCLCGAQAPFSAAQPGDCNDGVDSIHPGAGEVCNQADDDCNGTLDDEGAAGCVSFWYDGDHDGFGVGEPRCLCNAQGFHTAATAGDCDDTKYAVNPGAEEVCNGVDEDCDGVVDDGVASPCGGCQAVCTLPVGPGTSGGDFEPTPENSSGVNEDPNGYLVLDSTKIDFPFLWIANSGEGTVSKVNTRSVCEVARYSVCTDPSRTAVDLNGNGIITCRGDGRVAKVAIFEQDCIDRNGNGTIETSRDADGDCIIQASERVTNDECVLWVVQPDGQTGTGCGSSGNGCARAAGVDRENNIWVGFWNSARLRKLRSSDGAVLQTHTLNRRPYGLAIDQNGTIWVASRDPYPHGLVKVDPTQGQVGAWNTPSGYVYGLAVDPWGKVWVASGESQGVHRFDPLTNQWTNTWSWSGRGNTRGVAASVLRDATGAVVGSKVYVANHTWTCQTGRHVSVVDAKTLTDESPVDLGALRGPVGVALDFDGYLWSVNQCQSSASKVDTTTKQVVATQAVGSSPYTYSDMTGYALKTITAPQGYYRHVFEGWPSQQTAWNLIYVDADLPGDGKTYVKVRFRVADTVGGLQDQAWFGPYGPYPPSAFPLDLTAIANIVGRYLEVEVTLYTTDANEVPRLKAVRVVASLK